jgi:hypothetical protein
MPLPYAPHTGFTRAPAKLTSSSGVFGFSAAGAFEHNSSASLMLSDSCCFVVNQFPNVAFSRAIPSRFRLSRSVYRAFTRSISA